MKKIRIIILTLLICLIVFRSLFIKKDETLDIKSHNYFKTTVRGSYLNDVLTDKMYSDRVTPIYIKIVQIDSGVDIRLADASNIRKSYSCPWRWYEEEGVFEVCPEAPYNREFVLVARQPLFKLTPTTIEGYWAEDYDENIDWGEFD